jgi:hypothetical protein
MAIYKSKKNIRSKGSRKKSKKNSKKNIKMKGGSKYSYSQPKPQYAQGFYGVSKTQVYKQTQPTKTSDYQMSYKPQKMPTKYSAYSM